MSPTRVPALTIEQIRAFCAVAESTTYAEAAEKLDLGTNHVPVIRRVDRLEKFLGLGKLVEADFRGHVSLNATGSQVLPAARQIREAAEALQSISPELRFGSYPIIAARLVAACPDLFEGEGALTLYDITERTRADRGKSLLNRLALGVFDLVVAPSGARTDSPVVLEQKHLYDWSLSVVLPGGENHGLYRRARLRPRQLAGYKIVCAPEGHRSRELVERAFDDDGAELVVATEAGNQEVLRTMASGSHSMVALLPSDSFGTSERLGPTLSSKVQREYGDSYALYHRRPANRKSLTAREQRVLDLVPEILRAFAIPGQEAERADLPGDLVRVLAKGKR